MFFDKPETETEEEKAARLYQIRLLRQTAKGPSAEAIEAENALDISRGAAAGRAEHRQRDLWSGSSLGGSLVASGINKLLGKGKLEQGRIDTATTGLQQARTLSRSKNKTARLNKANQRVLDNMQQEKQDELTEGGRNTRAGASITSTEGLAERQATAKLQEAQEKELSTMVGREIEINQEQSIYERNKADKLAEVDANTYVNLKSGETKRLVADSKERLFYIEGAKRIPVDDQSDWVRAGGGGDSGGFGGANAQQKQGWKIQDATTQYDRTVEDATIKHDRGVISAQQLATAKKNAAGTLATAKKAAAIDADTRAEGAETRTENRLINRELKEKIASQEKLLNTRKRELEAAMPSLRRLAGEGEGGLSTFERWTGGTGPIAQYFPSFRDETQIVSRLANSEAIGKMSALDFSLAPMSDKDVDLLKGVGITEANNESVNYEYAQESLAEINSALDALGKYTGLPPGVTSIERIY